MYFKISKIWLIICLLALISVNIKTMLHGVISGNSSMFPSHRVSLFLKILVFKYKKMNRSFYFKHAKRAKRWWGDLQSFLLRYKILHNNLCCNMLIFVTKVIYHGKISLHSRSQFSKCFSRYFCAMGCSLLRKHWILYTIYLMNFYQMIPIINLRGETISTTQENFLPWSWYDICY